MVIEKDMKQGCGGHLKSLSRNLEAVSRKHEILGQLASQSKLENNASEYLPS